MRQNSRRVGWGYVALCAVFFAAPAHGLVLTFDPVNANFEQVDQAYGDRVVATPQDGFSYGTDDGFTPNVTVDYGLLPTAIPALWTTGYGDLVNVLYEDQDGYGYLEVTFTADTMWNVSLHGLDMASYSSLQTINSVRVRDGAGGVLFEQTSVAVPGSGHLNFLFDPPLKAQVLVLAVDTNNLGTFSDNICVDNIRFSQVSTTTPVTPSTWGSIKALYR